MYLRALLETGCEPVVVIKHFTSLLLLQRSGMSDRRCAIIYDRLAECSGINGAVLNVQHQPPLQGLKDSVCKGGWVAGGEGHLASLQGTKQLLLLLLAQYGATVERSVEDATSL